MSAPRLNNVVLPARYFAACVTFYKDVLQLPLRFAGAEFCFVDLGRGVCLALHPAAEAGDFVPTGNSIYLDLVVDDLPAVVARLREHSAPILREWTDGDGTPFALTVDPEGTRIELYAPAAPTATGISLNLSVLPERLAVCRFVPYAAALPSWAMLPAPGSALWSLTRTADEVSLVISEAALSAEVTAERGWRALQVAGPLDFSLTGILASLTAPLAAAGIPLFALSTFDTDYVLVKEDRLAEAVATLQRAGHKL